MYIVKVYYHTLGAYAIMEDDIKIGLIHASREFISQVLRLAKIKNYNVTVAPFSIDLAIPAAKKMETDGIDIIISRRFTATLIRQHTNVPVLAVPVTFFDVYESIWRASKKWSNVWVPLFRGSLEIEKTAGLNDMIDAKISYYEYDDQEQLETAIKRQAQNGCQGVVGGPNVKKLAMRWGMECEEIKSSDESIRFTLDEAFWIAANRKKENENTELYKTIVNMSLKGVVAIDKNGVIRISSKQANKIFNIEQMDKINNIYDFKLKNKIYTAIKMGKSFDYHVESVSGKPHLFEYFPVQLENKSIGGILTIQDTESIIRAETEVRKIITKGLISKYSLNQFIYKGSDSDDLISTINKYADTESTILITGPTGTGKEIVAHSIHGLSKRRLGPFVSINCASIPEQLLESELFGYEEGSFTGAKRGGKIGLFELAHKGTIFLDEIGSMPLDLQGRLLRVLQEREIMRIGGDKLIPIDVRVLAATNQDLSSLILLEKFREDLFFRINVLNIKIPALRERSDDIPYLIQYLINHLSKKNGIPIIKIPAKCVKRLCLLPWPGNVRELSSFIERLIILCAGTFSQETFEKQYVDLATYSNFKDLKRYKLLKTKNSKTVKSEYVTAKGNNEIHRVLQESQFNKSVAAKRLGISRMTLWRKLNNHRLQTDECSSRVE
jgi:transcriptional regulator, propionate catabolism operon regulatory protein